MTRSSQSTKRRYRKFEEIKGIVDDYNRSKLTQKAFAKSRRIPLATFALWLRRVRAASSENLHIPESTPALIEIQAPVRTSASMFIVDFANGHRLSVPVDTDPAACEELIQTLANISCSR